MLEAMMNFAANDTIYGYTFLPEDEFKGQAPKSTTLDPFRTKDGWLTIAPFTDAQFERMCAGLGHPEWWTAVADRAERLRGILRGCAKLFPEKTTAEWLPILEEADVPAGPVHSYDTLFSDSEIVANDSFTTYQHPIAGKVRTPTPGPRFSETPAKLFRMPPKLGEHTDEVLREAGIDRTQIDELRSGKVIK
jgi:crotonobetainyl-CoA:carnitine CoA-transferase CaiB-like acyl-CoA transferase